VEPPLKLNFAPQPPGPIRVGIRFEDLWRYWSAFDNEYDIPNPKVAARLKAWYEAYLDWDWARLNDLSQPGPKPQYRKNDPTFEAWRGDNDRFEAWRREKAKPMPHPRSLPQGAQAQVASLGAAQAAPQGAAQTALLVGAAVQGIQV